MVENVKTNEEHVLLYQIEPRRTRRVLRMDKPNTDSELSTIPIKKGKSIHLLPIYSLYLLEAADKYAYAYTATGEKLLCDYSLAYLEDKLPSAFKRVHRSYIVNTKEISHIQPFDQKRFVISFHSAQVPSVTSSAGYQKVVKELTRI